MFCTAISRKPAATCSGPRRPGVIRGGSGAGGDWGAGSPPMLGTVPPGYIAAGGGGDRVRQAREQAPGRAGVQRLVAALAEDLGEVARLYPAEQHVGVGDGQRAAVAVARGAGVGARRVRADPVTAAVEVQDRTAAGRHRVDRQHRGAHPDPGDLRLVLPLELPRVVRHVGGRPAHVEADHPAEARRRGRPRHAHDAAGRAGQDRVLAAEAGRVGQPAVGLHEQQPHSGLSGVRGRGDGGREPPMPEDCPPQASRASSAATSST